MLGQLRAALTTNLTWRQALYANLVLAFSFTLPILMADAYFADDAARRVSGFNNWETLGRPFTEILMRILTLSSERMSDPGRLLQILCIPLLAYSATQFNRSLFAKPNIRTVLVSSFVIVNPYLLANLSYRYDSLSMILAYALTITAATLIVQTWKRAAIALLLLFLALGLYQPMTTVFVGAAIIQLCVRAYRRAEPRTILRELGSQAAIYAAANVVYLVYLKLNPQGPSGSRSRLIPLSGESVDYITTAFREFTTFLRPMFAANMKPIIYFVLLWAGLGFVALVFSYGRYARSAKKKDRRYAWVVFIVLLASPLLVFAAQLGLMALLRNTQIFWRTLPGLGMLFAWMTFCIYVLFEQVRRSWSPLIAVPILAVPMLAFMNMAYVYGNYLQHSREYEEFVAAQLTQSMVRHDLGRRPDHKVTMLGYMGEPVSGWLIHKNYPAMSQVFPIGADWLQRYIVRERNVFVGAGMQHYYTDQQNRICNAKIRPLEISPWYEIYKDTVPKSHAVWFTRNGTRAYCDHPRTQSNLVQQLKAEEAVQ